MLPMPLRAGRNVLLDQIESDRISGPRCMAIVAQWNEHVVYLRWASPQNTLRPVP